MTRSSRCTSDRRAIWDGGWRSMLECPAIDEAVAHVSILAGDELPGEEYCAAFKEDLVRRHQPRWNVNLVGLAKTASE